MRPAACGRSQMSLKAAFDRKPARRQAERVFCDGLTMTRPRQDRIAHQVCSARHPDPRRGNGHHDSGRNSQSPTFAAVGCGLRTMRNESQGRQRSLALTNPEVIGAIHDDSSRGRRHHRDQHLSTRPASRRPTTSSRAGSARSPQPRRGSRASAPMPGRRRRRKSRGSSPVPWVRPTGLRRSRRTSTTRVFAT